MSKMIKLWLFSLALTVAWINCADHNAQLVKVRLALDWFPNANHAGLFLAIENGYFEQEGIDLVVYTPNDPATILATLGAGKDDFGFEYQMGVLLARSQGIPVISVAAIVQHPLNSVMALRDSEIERPQHLKGKTIGYPGIATDPPLLRTMLVYDGLSHKEANAQIEDLVNVGFDLVPALISGRVDAIVGAYWTHESISAENQGFPLKIMRMEEWGVPDFYELVLVTGEDKVLHEPALVKRFLRAIIKGYQEASMNPQAAIDALKTQHPEIDEGIERKGVELIAPLWTNGAQSFGWQLTSRWSDFANWMMNNDIISKEIDVSKAFTNQFLYTPK
jgi:putative hydroxymethylpyrimidine transport system substrate-binding protein